MAEKTIWYYASLYPQASGTLEEAGLFLVGRELEGELGLEVPIRTVSRRQFSLEPVGSLLHYQNLSETPALPLQLAFPRLKYTHLHGGL